MYYPFVICIVPGFLTWKIWKGLNRNTTACTLTTLVKLQLLRYIQLFKLHYSSKQTLFSVLNRIRIAFEMLFIIKMTKILGLYCKLVWFYIFFIYIKLYRGPGGWLIQLWKLPFQNLKLKLVIHTWINISTLNGTSP